MCDHGATQREALSRYDLRLCAKSTANSDVASSSRTIISMNRKITPHANVLGFRRRLTPIIVPSSPQRRVSIAGVAEGLSHADISFELPNPMHAACSSEVLVGSACASPNIAAGLPHADTGLLEPLASAESS